jgi:hypothetical protein
MKIHNIAFISGLVCYICGWYSGTFSGAQTGIASNEVKWKKMLIEADYAEYDRKTGIWQLRSMDDVVTQGLIISKGRIADDKTIKK